ncbi:MULTISPECIES: LysE family translocator [unclassified Leifsonia]|uniref:LysE family translocator n=1 Tax=unclassified Leifsonia TaxID=2663824 RepID=UPI0003681F8B|nr:MULTISPECIES: LysE family translocator [unclassified Leifsonia]TDP99534.1 threonine/homoserine/homoserine lactone efflux protein [Leifsonia sp. 115AMFTsu3.1]
MDPALVFGFWGVAALLVCTPGADWAYAVTAGLGGRTLLPSIGGILFGYLVVVVAVAVGLGALVAANPVLLDVLTVGGALYLLWLGISGLARSATPIAAQTGTATGGSSSVASFLRGAGVSGFNPKGLLVLVALVPQFTNAHGGWAPAAQMLMLGGLFVATCAVVYLTVAVLARRLLAARPRGTVVMARVSAIAMTLIGVALLAERVAQAF